MLPSTIMTKSMNLRETQDAKKFFDSEVLPFIDYVSRKYNVKIRLSDISRCTGFAQESLSNWKTGSRTISIGSINILRKFMDDIRSTGIDDLLSKRVSKDDVSSDATKIPTSVLRDTLKKYLFVQNEGVIDIAKKIGLSNATVYSFISDSAKSPHPKTITSIMNFLKDAGYLSSVGLPKQTYIETTTLESMPKADRDALSAMGINQVEWKSDTNVPSQLSDEYTNMLIIHAIMDSKEMNVNQKQKSLGAIFPQYFPSSK